LLLRTPHCAKQTDHDASAVFSTVSGLSFSVATILGGLLTQLLPDHFTLLGWQLCDLHVLFVISGVLRFGAALTGLRLREPHAHGVRALWTVLVGARPAPTKSAPMTLVRLESSVANDNGESAAQMDSPGPASSALAS
jgi:MFS family permease